MDQPKSNGFLHDRATLRNASGAKDAPKTPGGDSQELTTQKLFVHGKIEVGITCPNCQRTKIMKMEEFKGSQHLFRVKCLCGSAFNVLLEKRAYYRKPTNLKGFYSKKPDPEMQGWRLVVKKLSIKGMGFQIDRACAVRVGDIFHVQFTLDNQSESVIRGKVIVRNVNGEDVGAEFLELDPNAKKELGFFLMA